MSADKKGDEGENMAVDSEGRALPYSSAEVRSIVERALTEGTILAAINDIGVPCCAERPLTERRTVLDVASKTAAPHL